jgi:hypothetical protein
MKRFETLTLGIRIERFHFGNQHLLQDYHQILGGNYVSHYQRKTPSLLHLQSQ